jgi:hypothetical protein
VTEGIKVEFWSIQKLLLVIHDLYRIFYVSVYYYLMPFAVLWISVGISFSLQDGYSAYVKIPAD